MGLVQMVYAPPAVVGMVPCSIQEMVAQYSHEQVSGEIHVEGFHPKAVGLNLIHVFPFLFLPNNHPTVRAYLW